MKLIRPIITLLFALFTFSAGSNAQEVLYSTGDRFDYSGGDYSIVGMIGDFYYTYRNSNDGAMLEAFDDSMNKAATIMLDFFPAKVYSSKFICYKDKIVALYQGLESNRVVQYAALLDEKGRLAGKPVELGSAKVGIFGAMKSYFYTAVSEDKKKILVYTFDDKAKGVIFDCKWLDDSLHLLTRAHAEFTQDEKCSAGEVLIANDGTAYVSAFTTLGNQANASRFWMLALTQGDNQFRPLPMELGERFAANGYAKIDNVNNTLYFGGFYTNHKNGSYEGIIFTAYDANAGKYSSQKFIPFDEELKNNVTRFSRGKSFDNYMVRQLIIRNDGGFVMVSEAVYITTRSNYAPTVGYYSSFYSPFSTSTVREYHYNDILAISYDKDGNRLWNTLLPKEQYSQEDGGAFSSYLLINTGGVLGFLYNDYNSRRSRIQLATIDASGKMSNNSFEIGNNSPDWLPKAGKHVEARTVIVPCLRKKQICFAKVVF